VAPRHALILPDGKKAWDLSLCFDMRDIQRALADSLSKLPSAAKQSAGDPEHVDAWQRYALSPDQAVRSELEAVLAETTDETNILAALRAIRLRGHAGSIEPLRLLAARLLAWSEPVQREFIATVRALRLESEVGKALRLLLQVLPADPAAASGPQDRAALLPILADLDGNSVATRTFLLGCRTLSTYAPHAKAALEIAFGDIDAMAIERQLARCGGELDLAQGLAAGAAQPVRNQMPPPVGDVASLRDVDALTAELDRMDKLLREQKTNPGLHASHAQASLDLARRRIEDKQKGADLLLEDAEAHFQIALDRDPAHPTWWTERARCAYLRNRFPDEVAYAQSALGRLADKPDSDAEVREALRWLADGSARQIGNHAIDDPVAEIANLRTAIGCFLRIVATKECNHNDWAGLASSIGLTGLWREQLAIAAQGARVLPYSPDLRQCITDAARWLGRTDVLPGISRGIVANGTKAGAPSADSAWFHGQACLLAADAKRRAEQHAAALPLLAEAVAAFVRCRELEPTYADTCRQQLAAAWLATGMVHARLFQHEQACAALAEIIRTGAAVQELRDGCDCDVFDLVDRIVEWRERGPSPIDAEELQTKLEQAGAKDPFWPTALADALLREALRADGRNADRWLRDTVDAGGKPIRMMMGKPTEEGDRYLAASRLVARRAASPPAADRVALAQPHAIWAERQLDRNRLEGVADALTEAAAILGTDAPVATADEAALRAFAAKLRTSLGPARPRERMGR
jgi:tetratricopeptide (TPR) repeat protein